MAITRDNVSISIDGVLYVKVADAYKAAYGVEDAALRALYDSTEGVHWAHNADWLNASVGHCEWWGVHCDASGYVLAL